MDLPAASSSQRGENTSKPTPMPRKAKVAAARHEDLEEPIYANDESPESRKTRIPLRRLSQSFQEKMRAHGLEKSFRRMMKRKSVADSSSAKGPMENRCASLPDSNFFSGIAFTSPLSTPVSLTRNDSDDSTDTESFYTTSELPPSYPPPPLPDESTYDELTSAGSVSSDGPYSYYSHGSDTNSIYEELSNYLSLGKDDTLKDSTQTENSSPSYEPRFGSRYEEIKEELEGLAQPPLATFDECSGSSKSLVDEFDPLRESPRLNSSKTSSSLSSNPFADPEVMAFLNDEVNVPVYGKVNKKHDSILSDFEQMNFEMPQTSGPPPVPPRRFDSVSELEEVAASTLEVDRKRYSKLRSSIGSRVKQMAKYVTDNIDNSSLTRKNDKRGLIEKHMEENAINESSEEFRPVSFEGGFVPRQVFYTGTLVRPGGVKRWGQLSQRKLTLFGSKGGPDVKETFHVDSILSLRACPTSKISLDSEQVLCFEVSLSGKPQPVLFGTLTSLDRHEWMKKLLESVTPAFPPKLLIDYSKAGWCYLKEGISSSWCLSSVLLSVRSLHLVPSTRSDGSVLTADLRMARSIALQDGDLKCKKASEKGPVLLLDVQDSTLYLQMDTSSETQAWESVIRSAALNNGPALNQQQLTKDLVPTIVDKAINFVHTHGSASEGIYRRSGSNIAITKLLISMRKDAWSIQLSRTEYTEYDVASALKRFFRDLPEPLLVPELHPAFRAVVENLEMNLGDKLEQYKKVLGKLPPVNYRTVRRLVGHLYFIDKLNVKNLMPVDNLAAIWGPTLMHVQEGTGLTPNWSRVESIAVHDLIMHYPQLFDVPGDELRRELKILDVLENFHSNSTCAPSVSKRSGDLKVWVYLKAQEEGNSVSVAVPPGKLAREMCDELSDKMGLPGHALCLYEVVSGGHLKRPLHHSELVLDVILRWGDWAEVDRRDNCLVLTDCSVLQELVPLTCMSLLPAVDELKFADNRSKNFKSYLFELSQTALCCYKDKTCSVKIHEWALKDIIWYLGYEPKRNPHTGWAISFLTTGNPPSRTKDKPYFGHTLCGTTEQQKRKWMAALLMARHPGGILPPPVLIE